jgi:ABC-type phosphate transport system substrate-binding protein
MAVGQEAGEMRAFAGTPISFAGGAEIMRMLKKLLATAVVTASATALAVGPALADPINGSGQPVTPKETDIVGVGSDTIQFLLDQFSFDYNRTHKTGPRLYSWDALNPKTGLTDTIRLKAGCAKVPRPNGSSAGITALATSPKTGDKKHFCIDFARSSRPRNASSDPPKAKGGIVFVTIGKDAVTYATNATSNAPANLTTAQLNAIYSCHVTNWNQVGGKNGAIDAQLPQTSSGTRAFFLTAIGLGVPGPGGCVNSTAEENEGVNPVLSGPNRANVIFPFSIGKYIAEKFHSANCTNKTCTGAPACHPKAGQNRFGCDTHGNMVLRNINGTKPTTGTGAKTVINAHFTPKFVRTVFVVVRFSTTTSNHIPKALQPFFNPAHSTVKGWACANATAHADLINYGFLPTPFCGTGS